jgi:D-arabinose 5-phosphate isomerase GutQ/beta-phosphoglucomutase-like phosphatase (HAD superfamily)
MTHSLNDYDLFVFDFDGTIMDTEKFHYKAWINTLQTHIDKNIYFDYSTYIKNFHTIDVSNKKKYLLMKYDIENYDSQSYHTLSYDSQSYHTLSYDSLYELKQKEYNKLINENEVLLVNNFEKIIEFIHENNKKFVIVTNTSIKNINFFSEKYPIITKNVDKIYTKENFIKKKPHPECYLKVINDYPNHKIIGFEDSLYGFHCLYQVDKIKPVYIYHDDYYYNEYIIKTYDNIIVCSDYNLYNINVQLNLQKDVNNYTKTNNFIENIIDNNINQFILNKTNIQNIIYQITIILKSLKKENHIYLSGMGKSGYICKKSASTWQSLSLKCSYIDLPNLPHGDFGIFRDQDVIILISNSGNTDEIIYILKYLKENSENFKITTISIVANKDSKMEEYSDYTFVLNNIKEADVINMTPSTSSLIFMSILDGIAINIRNDISKDEFKLYHPAGALGKRI